MTLAVLLTTSTLMTLSGATIAKAEVGGSSDPVSSAVASGQTITASVWGSGSKAGSAGSGDGGRVDVSVPAPCWMAADLTGKDYFHFVASGQMARDNYNLEGTMTPEPGYQKYKDDDLGHWYAPHCEEGNWPDQNDDAGFTAFELHYYQTHPWEYVPANETPPQPPVPPELLREIAVKNLKLPDPALDWNPKLRGNQGTLVNLDTWFWLDNAPGVMTVHAAAGGNEASVTATFAGMKITAPGEAPLSCAGPGTAYTAGAHTTCALAFSRASSALGAEATPVTVKTRWTGTWTANGDPQGPLTRQPAPVTATADIRVGEIQTLVTSAG